MTFTDEEIPAEEQLEDEAGGYPEAFGITFTPPRQGIALAVLGFVVAGVLWWYWGQNALQNYTQSRNDLEKVVGDLEDYENLDQKKQEIQTKVNQLSQEIANIRSQQRQVFSLLSSEESLDTLLVDLQNIVQDIRQQGGNELELTSFSPTMDQIQTLDDGSLGSDLNGKIRHRTYNVEVEGTFAETQLLIKRLEELEPLLVINNFQTQVTNEQLGNFSFDENRFIVTDTPTLQSSFELQAILPVDEEKLREIENQAGENNQNNKNEENE